MNYNLTPETFFVEELFNPQLSEEGRYFYYLLDKKGISHKKAVERLLDAGVLGIHFSGIKDKNAHTRQWLCSENEIREIREKDFSLRFMGKNDERIHIGIHRANLFQVKAHLSKEEFKKLKQFRAGKTEVCNYFGEQRFDERARELAELLSKGNYEEALKLFICRESKFDTPKAREMKGIIESNWGKWGEIKANPLIKETGKERLFGFLEKNQGDFEGAFRHAERNSLKMLLKACQSQRFNEELERIALERKKNSFTTEINGRELPLQASKAFPRKIAIKATPFEKRLGARSLERKTFFYADKFKAIEKKDFCELSFELPKGSYATIFLAFIEKWVEENLQGVKEREYANQDSRHN